jgi:hypothetical protein
MSTILPILCLPALLKEHFDFLLTVYTCARPILCKRSGLESVGNRVSQLNNACIWCFMLCRVREKESPGLIRIYWYDNIAGIVLLCCT